MRRVLSVLIFLITLTAYGQKEANVWYFGENAGLDFSSGSPVTLTNGQLITDEGSASISDINGNLLFYTDGSVIYNKNHAVMSNGSGLLGNSSSAQSAIIVPKPTNLNIYYVFTVGNQTRGITNGVHFSEIDMTLEGGLGAVTIKNTALSQSLNAREKITSVEGANCDTFWVITADLNQFHAYLVDDTGVNTVAITSTNIQTGGSLRGYLKLSPGGTKVVNASNTSLSFDSYIYDFDDATGIISNGRNINVSGGYGVEFSRSSSKLYISTGGHSQGALPETGPASVFQFSLDSNNITDINASRQEIYTTNTGYRGALQLGPDGKIYYAQSRTDKLGVINFPEKDFNEIDFNPNGVDLNGKISTEGLPPFISSFFTPVKILDSDTKTIDLTIGTHQVCIGDSFSFEPELDGIVGSTFKWTKTGDSRVNITTREITIDHAKYGSGTYNLEMKINDSCGRVKEYNGSVEILFVPKPTITAIPVYEQCDVDGDPIDGITSFNLQSKEPELINNATGITVDFFETSDTSFSAPILNEIDYINTVSTNFSNHKLIVRATNDASGCQEYGELELKANATPPKNYSDLYLCEVDLNAAVPDSRNSAGSGKAFYDFDAKTTSIIAESAGAFSLGKNNFEYFRTEKDAILQTNQIVTPYEDDLFTNNSDVFVRISIKGSNACSGIGQFKIFINTRPIPQGNGTAMYLCVNNPIDNPQPITIDLNGSTGTRSDTYQWFLNGNLITDATSAIYKANVQGTYKVEAYRAYKNDVTDATDDSSCTGYNSFTVIESNKAIIVSTDLIDDQDNPEANILTITVSGIGEYEYALNGTNLTDFTKGTDNLTFTFNDVKPGLNTVYIRDVNGCGFVNSQKLSFLFFQRHFSPNNDGVYDTWKILGANNTFYKSARVEIFDRYGKVVALITNKDGNGWDGTYNGSKLPSNDYWFNAILEDINGNVRKETGHFSLLRK